MFICHRAKEDAGRGCRFLLPGMAGAFLCAVCMFSLHFGFLPPSKSMLIMLLSPFPLNWINWLEKMDGCSELEGEA